MITIRHLLNKHINVFRGMSRCWEQCFRYGDSIRTGSIENMLLINGHEVTFDFAEVRGAKTIRDGFTCIFILWKTESSLEDDNKLYLTKIGIMVKPFQNEGEILTAEDFVDKHALAKFTTKQAREWEVEGKLEILKS